MSSNPLPPGITNPSTQCTTQTCPLALAQIFYIPSLAGNIIYLTLFSLLLLEQLRLGMQYRTWGFMCGMFGGLVLEICGYVGRVMMHFNPFKVDPFLMYIICLTVAPAFLSASIYLCLSRLIVVSARSNTTSRLKPRTYTAIFVTADVISLLLQAAGGAIASIAAKAHPRTLAEKKMGDHGVKIMVSGLAFQVVSLCVFFGLWGEFEWRLRRVCGTAGEEVGSKVSEDEKVGGEEIKISEGTKEFDDLITSPRFYHFKIALWIAAVLIFIRSVYRVIELNAGFDGKLANNEPSFMILEGPMIILAVFALTVLHPGSSFAGRWNEANWSFRSKV